jgi:hypothetical protein
MGDVIQLFKKHGYRFISLDEAISRKTAHSKSIEQSNQFVLDSEVK